MDLTVVQNLHHSFVELENLEESLVAGKLRWVERARWIKLEEDVDFYTNQWSAPFIPALSFKAVSELKACLEQGCICIGMQGENLVDISEAIMHLLVSKNLLSALNADHFVKILLARHKHIRKKRDAPKLGHKWLSSRARSARPMPKRNTILPADLRSICTVTCEGEDMSESQTSINPEQLIDISGKLPFDTEVTTILTAKLEMIKQPMAIFIRLEEAAHLGNMAEVSCPVRFICLIAGPQLGTTTDYFQLGRCLGTLMSDSQFLTLAYCMQVGNDLISGIDRFLEECAVLPPGDWHKRNCRQSIPRWLAQLRKKPIVTKYKGQARRNAIVSALPETVVPNELQTKDPLARTGRPFGCLLKDIKRKIPHYLDDFRDILDIRCLAAVLFIYLAVLAPTITFGGLMGQQTNKKLGVSEMILAAGSAGIVFSLFAGQPLIIVGSTGPMTIIETNIYTLAETLDVEFMPWRLWIGIWVVLICLVIIAFDLCGLVRMVTRFTEEIFAVLVSMIFIHKAIAFIVKIFKQHPVTNHDSYTHCHEGMPNASMANYTTSNLTLQSVGDEKHPCYSLMTAILILLTFFLAFYLRKIRSSRYFSLKVRHIISDFSVIIAVGVVILIDHVVGDDFTEKLTINKDYISRRWIINPFGEEKKLHVGYVFLAIIPAFLVTIILFIETGITAVMLDKKENKLKKGFAYHLDLLIVACLVGASSIVGLPWMCTSPVNSLSHFHTLTVLSLTHAPGTNPFIVKVKEQRVTNIMIHLLIFGSMLLIPMLERIPIAILFGVFLYLGFTSLLRMEFIHRLQLLFIPYKLHPDTRFVRKVQTKKIHLFTLIQLACVVVLAIVKETNAAVVFPFLIMCLVPLRGLLRLFFSEEELEDLDNEEDEDEFVVSNEYEIFTETSCPP